MAEVYSGTVGEMNVRKLRSVTEQKSNTHSNFMATDNYNLLHTLELLLINEQTDNKPCLGCY